MSKPVHTMAQYSNSPSAKPVGRIAFAEDVTEIKPTIVGTLSSPPTPHRKASFHEEPDPPRSFSDTTHGSLRSILTNRNVQPSTGSRFVTSVKPAPSSKPLPKLPFSNMNSHQQPPETITGVGTLPSPTESDAAAQSPWKTMPRNSLSLPLAISQRTGFKWPRPEGIDVAKANAIGVSIAPSSAPVKTMPSLTANVVRGQKSESTSTDERYAAKGYSWARPKPLRLSNATVSPSDNQFAHAAQASHQAVMNAALDAIHQKISSLDDRSEKLCFSLDKLTKAIEILTRRLNSNSVLDVGLGSNDEQNQFSRKSSLARPSVDGSSYVDTNSGNMSPRLSEATLHGAQTPTNIKGSNIFDRNPFEVRVQSHGSNISDLEEEVTEVQEIMRKRSNRGRQQSFWDSETDEEDEEVEENEIEEDQDNTKSEYDDKGFMPPAEDSSGSFHQHNKSTGSWMSDQSPLTTPSTEYHHQVSIGSSQIPNLPVVHETPSLQSSPPRSEDSPLPTEADPEEHEEARNRRKHSIDTIVQPSNPLDESSASNQSPLLRAASRSLKYSDDDSGSTPLPPPCLTLPPPLHPSTIASPAPTPINTPIASALHRFKSTPSPGSKLASPFPAPSRTGVNNSHFAPVNYTPTKLHTTSQPHSPSLSNRSYSSSISSNPDAPPARPAWYFFYGQLMDPSFLTELLNLKSPPTYYRARVWSREIKYYGAYPAAVPARHDFDKYVEGAAWYVPEKDMAAWLRSHEEGEGRMIEGEADIDFLERIPEIDRRGANDGMAKGRMFLWKGDADALMDHPAI